ncbi:DUF2062 domain-containing protein [Paenibacillus kandeliae]|uniref:DUF2062 domain-containing protein n=1 Tax=Paenibacillus kandeliae TaxID=3231269 RepID=UPI003457EE98
MKKLRIGRYLKLNTIRLLRLKKGSHQVAIGFAVGLIPSWYPLLGIGPLISLGLNRLFKGALPAAIFAASLDSFVWPLTFFLNYHTGHLLVSLISKASWPTRMLHIRMPDWPEDYMQPLHESHHWRDAGLYFATGAAVNSIVFAVIIYIIIKWVMLRYRLPLLHLLRRKK